MDASNFSPVGPPKAAKPEADVVFMDGVSSLEYLFSEAGEPERVLKSIQLRVRAGECWGITGRPDVAVRLLLEIMSNLRPYDAGTCILVGRGMMRHKRVILPHVFYIGSTEMLYGHMNVLEYLMLALSKLYTDRLALQDILLHFLLQAGLGDVTLTAVATLTEEQKAVVSLAAASFSESKLIVFNFPGCEFGESEEEAIAFLAGTIRQKGGSLVLGTGSCRLIDKACSHTAFLSGGTLLYQGTADDLKQLYDTAPVIIRDEDLPKVRERLAPLLPGCRFREKDGALYVGSTGMEERAVYEALAKAELPPDSVERNPKTVQSAYEELTYDLPK